MSEAWDDAEVAVELEDDEFELALDADDSDDWDDADDDE